MTLCFLDFCHFWHDCWSGPIDYLIRFWSIFVLTLNLNFQGQIWTLLNLSQKWSACHKTKSKHIYWTQGLKCCHWVWPWPWPWPWIFKGKYGICCISTKMVRLPSNKKQTYRLNSCPQMRPMGLTLTMTLTFWIFKVKCDLDLWPHTWPWPWIFMGKFWNGCISEWEGQLILNKGGGSRSFMTMAVTIWWLRPGVRIYQIVTGVTSDVSVPSTHLVHSQTSNICTVKVWEWRRNFIPHGTGLWLLIHAGIKNNLC